MGKYLSHMGHKIIYIIEFSELDSTCNKNFDGGFGEL